MIINFRFPEQFTKTSASKFRTPVDMQFAFSYYYFIIHSTYQPTEIEFLKAIDFNQDNELSVGELSFLRSRLFKQPVKDRDIANFNFMVETCLTSNSSEADSDLLKGKLKIEDAQLCPEMLLHITQSIKNVHLPTYEHEITDNSEVTFLLIMGDHKNVRKELDKSRKSLTKFICINDDETQANADKDGLIAKEYSDYRLALFPDASPFENVYASNLKL